LTEGIVNHLAFSVENVEEEMTRLKQLGVEFDNDIPRVVLGGVKIAFFTGPDGEVLELVER
jgi:lactoylglutathione lyase